jgi:hypothetical protein
MFSPVEDTHQKRMDSMELSWMNFDVCQTCNDSKATKQAIAKPN